MARRKGGVGGRAFACEKPFQPPNQGEMGNGQLAIAQYGGRDAALKAPVLALHRHFLYSWISGIEAGYMAIRIYTVYR
jgi:hypothetical protein